VIDTVSSHRRNRILIGEHEKLGSRDEACDGETTMWRVLTQTTDSRIRERVEDCVRLILWDTFTKTLVDYRRRLHSWTKMRLSNLKQSDDFADL